MKRLSTVALGVALCTLATAADARPGDAPHTRYDGHPQYADGTRRDVAPAGQAAGVGTPQGPAACRRGPGRAPRRPPPSWPAPRGAHAASPSPGPAQLRRFRARRHLQDVPHPGRPRAPRAHRGAIRVGADRLHLPPGRRDRRHRPAVPARQRQRHRLRHPGRPQGGGGALADREPSLRRRHDVRHDEPHPRRHRPTLRGAEFGWPPLALSRAPAATQS